MEVVDSFETLVIICLYSVTLKKEAASSSETSITIYQKTIIFMVTVVRTSYLTCSKDVSATLEGGIYGNLRGAKWRWEKGNCLLRSSTIGVVHRVLLCDGIKKGEMGQST
jgi:hypothetical protein